MTEANERPVPPLTEAMRRAARRQPGGWIYAIDPAFEPDGSVPPHGVIGAWKVDGEGEVTGEFRPNPNYRPSPAAMGLPAPTDPLDEAAQLAVTGYASTADAIDRLVEREVYVTDDEGPTVEVFSSPAHVPADAAARARPVAGGQLATRLGRERELVINPGGEARLRLTGAEVVDRAEDRARERSSLRSPHHEPNPTN
jgi:hypothetical protein